MIIAEDFNIDWSKEGVYKTRISNIINDSFLKQMVKYYTRIAENLKIIIDYRLSNKENLLVIIKSIVTFLLFKNVYYMSSLIANQILVLVLV